MAAPTEEQLEEKIPSLREHFFSKFADTVSAGEAYDECDIQRIREDDRYVKCFMRAYNVNMEVEEPAVNIDKVLRWRKELGINQFKMESLPKELTDDNAIYWSDKKDNQGHRILMLKVAKHKKGKHIEETKKYIAHLMDQHHKVTPGDPDRIIFIFDFSGAGITNVDLEVVKFIISSLSNFFPSLLSHLLLFEMPWLLSAVWKVIQSWLSKAQKEKITLVKKADITKYIDEDNLEEHMKK